MFKSELNIRHPWSKTTMAVFQKYPNPFANHVLSADVIERYVDAQGVLHSTRLFLKRGILPAWARRLFKVTEAYVLEHSTVNLKTRTMTTTTQNLCHRNLMVVRETQVIAPQKTNTTINVSAQVFARSSWAPIKRRIEQYALNTIKKRTYESAQGLGFVLENLRLA